MQKVYNILSNEPEVECIFNMMFCFSGFGNKDRYVNMVKNFEKISKPIFFWLVGQAGEIRRVSQLLSKNNIPNFPSLEDMIKNFAVLVQESRNKNKK
jgi:acyl-CoA synthetase (NDP forming)